MPEEKRPEKVFILEGLGSFTEKEIDQMEKAGFFSTSKVGTGEHPLTEEDIIAAVGPEIFELLFGEKEC